MIIECPACQSRYRIREEKLPAGGGNIKCPNCAHVFFVTMSGQTSNIPAAAGAGAPPPVAMGASPRVTGQMTATPSPNSAPTPLPGYAAGGAPPPVAPGGTIMMTAPPIAPTPVPAGPGTVMAPITGVNAAIGQKWKLKNQIGLVYDFADTESIRRWLQAREALDGLVASRDNGATWESLESFDELRDIKATGRKTVAGMAAISGGVDPRAVAQIAAQQAAAAPAPPPSPEVLREQAQARLDQARKTRDGDGQRAPQAGEKAQPAAATGKVEKQKKSQQAQLLRKEEAKPGTSMGQTIGAALLLVVALGVFAWGLNKAGIVQLGGRGDDTSMPSGPAPVPPSALTPPTAAVGTDAARTDGTSRLSERDRAREALDRAATAMTAGDSSSAIGYLERAAYLDPTNEEIACQLAVLYLRENRTADAAAARRRCEGDSGAPEAPTAAPALDPNAPAVGDAPPGEMPPGEMPPGEMPPGAAPGEEPFDGPNIVETRIVPNNGSGSSTN